MIYPEYRKGNGMVIVDGYSNRKAVKTAIKDMGRWVRDNLDKGEGQLIIDYPEEVRISFDAKKQGGYFLEVEEVPCASKWHEDTDEMEYEEANYYVVVRFTDHKKDPLTSL